MRFRVVAVGDQLDRSRTSSELVFKRRVKINPLCKVYCGGASVRRGPNVLPRIIVPSAVVSCICYVTVFITTNTSGEYAAFKVHSNTESRGRLIVGKYTQNNHRCAAHRDTKVVHKGEPIRLPRSLGRMSYAKTPRVQVSTPAGEYAILCLGKRCLEKQGCGCKSGSCV